MELGNEFSLFSVFSLFWVRFGGFVGVAVVVRIFSGGGLLVGGGNFFFLGVILVVAELVFVAKFWWKVLGGFARERDKKVERKERWKRRERNRIKQNYLFICLFILFAGIIYIILMSCM